MSGSVLRRASARYALHHPWQLFLALVGIALGVAVVVAIDLTIDSSRRAFALTESELNAGATHSIVGGPAGLPEALYVDLRRAGLGVALAPRVEGTVRAGARDGARLRLIGLDPFSEAPFRSRFAAGPMAGEARLVTLLTRPGGVLVTSDTAARLDLAPGARLAVLGPGGRHALEIVGVLAPEAALVREALQDVLVADIATAQEVLGSVGRLSAIDVRIEPESGTAATLEAAVPAVATLVPAERQARSVRDLTAAFDLNLTMLSLLALVVGMFLVYNTVSFSVVQRRGLIGRLRAIGVTRGQVFALVVGEACVVAFVAACLGLGLGRLLAEGLIGLVSQTINDHYVAVTVRAVHTSPRVVVEAFVLGLGAAVVAAAAPAWEATRVTPRAALSASDEQRGARRAMPRAGALGLMLLATAGALLALPTTSVGVGFAALFAVVSGAALLAPAATALGIRALSPAGARLGGVAGSVGMRGVAAGLGRTAVAVAALMVALSATVGVGVMVDSFRGSVADWLGTTLRADLYVGVEGPSGFVRLPAGLAGQIAGIPGVDEVSQGRRFRAESSAGPVRALALRMARESYQGFDLVAGDLDRAWLAFDREGAVLVSEPLAWRRGLGPGSRITLRTDQGPTPFTVAGVYRDYRSDQGGVLMSRDTYRRFWDDDAVTGLGVYLAPGTDARRVRAAVADLLPGDGSLRVRSNAGIREASLEVFDRTFTITRVLRWLAVIVAFVGVLSALMALALERAREVAVLRSLGFTRGQVWGLVQLQTGVLGLLAGLFAIPLGLLLAVLLVQVINRRSFGWTMALDVDPSLLAQAPALALAAALLAGLYPAWRMATTPPAAALRSD